jgi:hypothetical protein
MIARDLHAHPVVASCAFPPVARQRLTPWASSLRGVPRVLETLRGHG